jgi:hypothetical protein
MAFYETVSKIQAYASYAKKAVIGATTAILAVTAVVAPSYSDEAGFAVGIVVAVLGAVAQYKATNGPKPKKV